jgi:hypothetical protein
LSQDERGRRPDERRPHITRDFIKFNFGHALARSPEPYASKVPSEFPSYCRNAP